MKTLKFTLIALFGLLTITAFADDKTGTENSKNVKTIALPEMTWGTPEEVTEIKTSSIASKIELPAMVWGDAANVQKVQEPVKIKMPEMVWGNPAEISQLMSAE